MSTNTNDIDKIDSTWSKDYIIRYLYVALAPFFQKDPKYFLADDETKLKEFKQGFINRGNNIVCSTLVDYYIELFKDFGITAKKIAVTDTTIPLYAMIVKGDVGFYLLDPINDLFNNQYGLKTKYFSKIPNERIKLQYPFLSELNPKYISYMDKKLLIFKRIDSYFDYLHDLFLAQNKIHTLFGVKRDDYDLLFQRTMEFANSNLINLGNVPGPIEREMVYTYIKRRLFSKNEKKKIEIYLTNNGNTLTPLIKYISPIENKSTTYIEEKKEDHYCLKRIK